jgi:hypothetical protein
MSRRMRVSTGIWEDPDFTSLSRSAQLLWFYAKGLRMTGAVTVARVSRKVRWDAEAVRSAWLELAASKYAAVLDPVTPKRRRMPTRTSQLVFDRDGRKCLHCGTTQRLTIDHIWPVSRGGSDDLENLQTLCHSCNAKKGARVDAHQIDQA